MSRQKAGKARNTYVCEQDPSSECTRRPSSSFPPHQLRRDRPAKYQLHTPTFLLKLSTYRDKDHDAQDHHCERIPSPNPRIKISHQTHKQSAKGTNVIRMSIKMQKDACGTRADECNAANNDHRCVVSIVIVLVQVPRRNHCEDGHENKVRPQWQSPKVPRRVNGPLATGTSDLRPDCLHLFEGERSDEDVGGVVIHHRERSGAAHSTLNRVWLSTCAGNPEVISAKGKE